jgi:hypothetical protein
MMLITLILAVLWLAVMLVVVVICHMAAQGDRALAKPLARAPHRGREVGQRAA